MPPLRLGIAGAGSIGIRGVMEHLVLPDTRGLVEMAAVCDPVPGRATAAAEKYGIPQAFEDYDDMLARGDIDAVTICSPIGLHYAQGLSAVRAGKHVHFNKTMTVTTAESDDLISEAESAGVKLVASPGQMLRPSNQRIREQIREGAIGRLVWAATGAAFGKYHETEDVRQGSDLLSNVDPTWYWRSPGGGPLYDMTVYGLHTLTGILGPARRVTALSGIAIPEREFCGVKHACDAHDNSLILLDFGDSAYAFAYGTAAGSIVKTFGQPNFYGTSGSIEGLSLNGEAIDYPGREIAESSPNGAIALLPHVQGTPHASMPEAHVFEDLMQLVDLVQNGVPTSATAEHARHVIDIIESAYRASESGETQSLRTTFQQD